MTKDDFVKSLQDRISLILKTIMYENFDVDFINKFDDVKDEETTIE